MIQLSVGQVSAVIAAIITALQLFFPTALALLIVGLLKNDMSATTWSSVGATLHSSYWATFLRADTATSVNVQGSVKWLLRIGSLGLLLIAVASIITPIGLYETVEPNQILQAVSFPYIADTGPFGYGTPERSTLGFNRLCGVPTLTTCPGSDTIEVKSDEFVSSDFPFGYNSRIPAEKIELLQSGLQEQQQTVSSFFDIQFRSHNKLQDPDINNGTFYDAGAYRQLDTLVLKDTIEAVEGLVVDMINGRIAFRNHTLPAGVSLGATWDEDLLVMEPETQCVDTNLTIDFTTSGLNGTLGGNLEDIVLTDRGGFANIATEVATYDKSSPQVNADLASRAYQSAWYFNALLAIYYNVTRPSPNAFGYIASKIDRTFQLPETTLLGTDKLVVEDYSSVFSTFLANDNSSFNSDDSFPFWPNPFNISRSNFSEIANECNGVVATSKSNMSNIAVGCGLVFGVPRLADGQTKLAYDPGVRLSMPLLSCASAVKMNVKKFSFRFNGTEGLSSLRIDSISDQSSTSKPLYWGIENNSGLDVNIQDAAPLWGLVSSTTPESDVLSVVKSPHLYLPGNLGTFTILTQSGSDNVPGSTFPIDALSSLYGGDVFDPDQGFAGYGGKNSVAMFAQWQRLSATANGTARIINLIYADLAANALIGTKSWLPSSTTIPGTGNTNQKRQASTTSADASQTAAQVPVRVFSRQIRYRWLYGIPAYVCTLLSAVIGSATLLLVCMGRASTSKMRAYLHATSVGRGLSLFLYPGECEPQTTSSRWVRGVGNKKIRIGKPTWMPHATQPLLYPDKMSNSSYATGLGGFGGYENDDQPLIDQKTGAAIQLTPIASPMPPTQPGFGTPTQDNSQHLHQGYLSNFGSHHIAGQVQNQFPPPPNQTSNAYPMGGFAR
jgi:hypothetical protein